MSNQTPLNHQCAICGKWYKPDPQMAGIACAVFHSPGSCCHYSEIEVVTPPMPDKTPRQHSLRTCDYFACHVGGGNCPFLANSKYRPTPPTEPQEVEALELYGVIQAAKASAQALTSHHKSTTDIDMNVLIPGIEALLARERTQAAIDELTAFKDLAMVYSDGSPANMIVMDEEEAVTYIDDRIAALTAQQKGEQ